MTISVRKRRSERLILDVPLVIRGEGVDRKKFQEESFTQIVNAHGALLLLKTKVAIDQKLLLMNPNNWHECEARVVYVGPPDAGLAQVGIELDRPVPEFWLVTAPPADRNQS